MAPMSLLANDKGTSGISHCQWPCLVRHTFITFGSAWVQSVNIKWASVWSILVLAKVKAVKESKQYLGPIVDSIEV